MRLQEPVTRHGATDRLLLHQILAVALSARKLLGWEASSLLLRSALDGLRSGYSYPSHIDRARTAVDMPACGLVGGFLYAPFLFGLFFFLNSGGMLVPNVEAVSPVVRKLAFLSKVFGLFFCGVLFA